MTHWDTKVYETVPSFTRIRIMGDHGQVDWTWSSITTELIPLWFFVIRYFLRLSSCCQPCRSQQTEHNASPFVRWIEAQNVGCMWSRWYDVANGRLRWHPAHRWISRLLRKYLATRPRTSSLHVRITRLNSWTFHSDQWRSNPGNWYKVLSLPVSSVSPRGCGWAGNKDLRQSLHWDQFARPLSYFSRK